MSFIVTVTESEMGLIFGKSKKPASKVTEQDKAVLVSLLKIRRLINGVVVIMFGSFDFLRR